jgi:hypothetical protein
LGGVCYFVRIVFKAVTYYLGLAEKLEDIPSKGFKPFLTKQVQG